MQDPATCCAHSHRLSPKEKCRANVNGCGCNYDYSCVCGCVCGCGCRCGCGCECRCRCKCERRVEETVGYSKSTDRRQPPSIYIDQQIFRLLLPALEETLLAADKWNVLRVTIQKCRFNGIDRLAEILWNRNPYRSKTIPSRVHAFDIPLFQRWLSLRPPYPKSWLWTRDEAALCLQRYVRGWLVRKRVDVQELRQFWKDFAEKDLSNKQLGDRIGQQEATAIKDGTRIADAGKDESSTRDAGFLRCKAYRRAIAAGRTNHLKPKDNAVV